MRVRQRLLPLMVLVVAACTGDTDADDDTDSNPGSDADTGAASGTDVLDAGTAVPVGEYFSPAADDLTGVLVRARGDDFEFLMPVQWDDLTATQSLAVWIEAEIINSSSEATYVDCGGSREQGSACRAFTTGRDQVGETGQAEADVDSDPVGLTIPLTTSDGTLFIVVDTITYEVQLPIMFAAVRTSSAIPFLGEFPMDNDGLIGVLESL
jgi:hypothetical protein